MAQLGEGIGGEGFPALGWELQNRMSRILLENDNNSLSEKDKRIACVTFTRPLTNTSHEFLWMKKSMYNSRLTLQDCDLFERYKLHRHEITAKRLYLRPRSNPYSRSFHSKKPADFRLHQHKLAHGPFKDKYLYQLTPSNQRTHAYWCG